MKKSALFAFLLFVSISSLFSQVKSDTTIYMITCAPGTALYSIYGHSAIRVTIESANVDVVYNWGVFDFSTPHFAWKFAKGRLNYMLDDTSYDRFMQEYMLENRSVYSQRINLEPAEKKQLLYLISVNLEEQNKYYRYDFFYDNCSTRIRDLIEMAVGDKLIYPPEEQKNPSYNQLLDEYQKQFPWVKFGVDMLMGMTATKKAKFRERMFLPLEMKENLSSAVVNRDRRMIPLLQSPATLLSFEDQVVKTPFYLLPDFVFGLILVIIVVISSLLKSSAIINYIDIFIFLLFSVLAVMMIFFNFFTDHIELHTNLNMLWFNPFILPALLALILRKQWTIWFRLVFYLAVISLPIVMLTRIVDTSFLPLILILAVRSSARSDFSWNPFTVTV
ncbi:MAG: DUF4105 domain-containing protein [Bacteroidales bacterium]